MYDDGQGVAQNYAEAVKWYSKAANQGVAEAQSKLGYCYYEGIGVAKNYEEAVKWYSKAANQGDIESCVMTGLCYGYLNDFSNAVYWFRRAAEQDHPGGMYLLGLMYNYGRGVSQDINLAISWMKKAAQKGQQDAQKFLKENGIKF